jgi:hypothetical protein
LILYVFDWECRAREFMPIDLFASIAPLICEYYYFDFIYWLICDLRRLPILRYIYFASITPFDWLRRSSLFRLLFAAAIYIWWCLYDIITLCTFAQPRGRLRESHRLISCLFAISFLRERGERCLRFCFWFADWWCRRWFFLLRFA